MTAYTVVELADESMDSGLDENGQIIDVVTRTFLAYAATADVATLTISDIINLPELPQINDEHPTVANCKVKKRTVARSADRNEAYNVKYTYEYDPLPTGGGGEQSVVSTTSELTGEFVDAFRVGASYPYNTSYPDAVDIGGNAIDSAGVPTSAFRRQVTYEKSFSSEFVDLPYVYSFVGTRNAFWWNGFGPGTLLYLGASLSVQTGGLVNRSDRFIYDPDYHLRQVVYSFDGDLNPVLNESGNAQFVKWVQPFPLLSNFFSLGIPD